MSGPSSEQQEPPIKSTQENKDTGGKLKDKLNFFEQIQQQKSRTSLPVTSFKKVKEEVPPSPPKPIEENKISVVPTTTEPVTSNNSAPPTQEITTPQPSSNPKPLPAPAEPLKMQKLASMEKLIPSLAPEPEQAPLNYEEAASKLEKDFEAIQWPLELDKIAQHNPEQCARVLMGIICVKTKVALHLMVKSKTPLLSYYKISRRTHSLSLKGQ